MLILESFTGASGAAGAGDQASLCLHTHLVTLKSDCNATKAQDVLPEHVLDTFHLDSSSIVDAMSLEVWAVNDVLEPHPIVS